MKNRCSLLLFLSGIILILCCSCASTSSADFGCKCAAVYGNYDSCVRAIEKSLADPDVRRKLEETPEKAAYYQQMLAVSEMYRGNIPQSMAAFEKSLHFKPLPLTYFFRAKHFLREGNYRDAETDIGELDNLLAGETEPAMVKYYQFLLALLPGDSHDKLWHNRDDAAFLRSRVEWLKKELNNNQNLSPGTLPIFHGVSSAKFRQIRYGMSTAQLQELLGKPDLTYKTRRATSAMAGLTAWCYQISPEKKIVEFFVSEKTNRIGDIRLFNADQYHLRKGKRQGATWFRPKNAPYVFGTPEVPR